MKLDFSQLDEFLTALRFAGLRMGVREVARCRQVMERWSEEGSELAPERWRALLAIALVRSKAERELFDRVFETWHSTGAESESDTSLSPAPLPKRRKPISYAHFGFWVAVALALGLFIFWPPAVEKSYQVLEELREQDLGQEQAAAGKIPQTELESATEPRPRPGPTGLWLGLQLPSWKAVLFTIALSALCAGMFRGYRKRSSRTTRPNEDGPNRILLGAQEARPAILLRAEQEALVWGAGRYLTEEMTSRLDLQATVEATARAAGFPVIRLEPARFQREVWLWLDEASEDGNLRQVANEVELTLNREDLPCERAVFRGLPDVLFTPDGRRFTPYDVEDRRKSAVVLVLSDGQLLNRRLQGHDRAAIETVFRELGAWPSLGLFLTADAPALVVEVARRHQVEPQEPGELTSFLASTRLTRGPESRDLQFWRAVCALGPSSMAEGTAAFLRLKLGLAVSPWQLATLRTEAGVGSGRLEWRAESRRELIEWLRKAEEGTNTLFDRALDLWIDMIYRPEIDKADADRALAGTVAAQLLRAERAMLILLLRGRAAQPRRVAAIEELTRIYISTVELRAWLRVKLGELDSADGLPDRLFLDFSWGELAAGQKESLVRMGFGGRRTVPRRAFWHHLLLWPYGSRMLTTSGAYWLASAQVLVLVMAGTTALSWSYLGYLLGGQNHSWLSTAFIGLIGFLVISMISINLLTLDRASAEHAERIFNEPYSSKFIRGKMWLAISSRLAIAILSLMITAPYFTQLIFHKEIAQLIQADAVIVLEEKRKWLASNENEVQARLLNAESAVAEGRAAFADELAGRFGDGLSGRPGYGPAAEIIRRNLARLEEELFAAQRARRAQDFDFEMLAADWRNQKEVLLAQFGLVLNEPGPLANSKALKELRKETEFVTAEKAVEFLLGFIFLGLLILKIFEPRSIRLYLSVVLQQESSRFLAGSYDHLLPVGERSFERSEAMPPHIFYDFLVNIWASSRAGEPSDIEDREKRAMVKADIREVERLRIYLEVAMRDVEEKLAQERQAYLNARSKYTAVLVDIERLKDTLNEYRSVKSDEMAKPTLAQQGSPSHSNLAKVERDLQVLQGVEASVRRFYENAKGKLEAAEAQACSLRREYASLEVHSR